MAFLSHPAQKRFLIAMPLGIAFGFLCSYVASRGMAMAFWWTPLMWSIVTDRMLIGLVIGFAGAFEYHPILGFRLYPCIRGTILGAFVSLPLAIGGMISPSADISAWSIFTATMIAGAIYGCIIDLVATRFGGQGVKIVK